MSKMEGAWVYLVIPNKVYSRAPGDYVQSGAPGDYEPHLNLVFGIKTVNLKFETSNAYLNLVLILFDFSQNVYLISNFIIQVIMTVIVMHIFFLDNKALYIYAKNNFLYFYCGTVFIYLNCLNMTHNFLINYLNSKCGTVFIQSGFNFSFDFIAELLGGHLYNEG